ncbi:hypothetical protein [Mycolicibacterium sp. S3B2]|uniref:hypothetical protein n=1 Tax=Mycolicibacterium sp. S3B2 TaxID=3415120 RepID=UPI003C7D649E
MVVAIITSLSTVLVAVVALLGTRMQARDSRNQLSADVEIMLKLEKGSVARTILENHVADSARQLASAERLRFADRRSQYFLRTALIFVALSMSIQIALGGSNRTSSLEYLRLIGEPMAWIFMLLGFTAILMAGAATIIDHRLRRKSRQRQELAPADSAEAERPGSKET